MPDRLPQFVQEAPSNNRAHGRKNEGWVHVTEEAPANGQQYARVDYGWTPVSAGAGVYTDIAPPPVPVADQLWFNTETGKTYIHYADGTAPTWVQIA